jgi:hypothetical protein
MVRQKLLKRLLLPVFSQLIGNLALETSSLVTASSSEESSNFRSLEHHAIQPAQQLAPGNSPISARIPRKGFQIIDRTPGLSSSPRGAFAFRACLGFAGWAGSVAALVRNAGGCRGPVSPGCVLCGARPTPPRMCRGSMNSLFRSSVPAAPPRDR